MFRVPVARLGLLKKRAKLGIVVNAFNPSIWEAGGFL